MRYWLIHNADGASKLRWKKVRQRDKDASLEHKYKPFVKTDTKKSLKI